MSKLKAARCPWCGRFIGRHDANRYQEDTGTSNAPALRVWHLACWQKREAKYDT